MLFRPSESSKRITDFYRRYLMTTFGTNNEDYNKQLKEALEKEGAISDGPYISLSDPYEKGKSLTELAKDGIVSKKLLELKNFYPNRALYRHQEEAVLKAHKGKNLIITTGTGSGKTESFLIPIINQLLQEKEEGTLGAGVRTLIVYPMNALVNDQIRRLRELLSGMKDNPKITFGRFTGETEERYSDALKKYEETEDIENNPLCENELISREQMRQSPPNILITNYAMLEYMLLRPGDSIIFSARNANKWKYMVFDEAHSYTGAKGIEVATLVKRIKAMLKRDDIKFILTSATLGDKNADDDIINFGQSLCNAPFDADSIIRSYTVCAKPEREIAELGLDIYRILAEKIRNNYPDEIIKNEIVNAGIDLDLSGDVSEILFDLILHDKFYYRVRESLFGQIKTVTSMANEIQVSVNDFTDFITVASNAMRNDERLFEAKYHMFLRGIEGIFVTLKPSNKLFINKMETYKEKLYDSSDIGYKVYEISFCSNCNALYITAAEEGGYLVQKSKFNDEYNPEVYLISGDFDEEEEEIADNVYCLCAKCGAIKRAASVNDLQCGHGKENINTLVKVKKKGENLHKCPCCHSINVQRSILRPYYLGSEAATAVIATALYTELPKIEHKVKIENYKDEFFGLNETREVNEQKVKAKQFLAFSDSRQAAAFFAPYLSSTYKEAIVKRIIYQIVQDETDKFQSGIALKSFVNLLADRFSKYHMFPEDGEERVKIEAWIHILKELSNFKSKSSLMKTGIIMFDIDFAGISALEQQGLDVEETATLFKILCKSMLRDGAVATEEVFTKADIAQFTVTGSQKGYDKTAVGYSYIESWSPELGKTNKRLKFVTKVLNGDESTARKLLDSMWNLLSSEQYNYVSERPFGRRKAYFLNAEKIKVKRVEKLYVCTECRTVTPYNLKSLCDNPRCNGHLVDYDFQSLMQDNHYYNLYTSLDITPMVVHEHTAQLSSEKAYEYQKNFKDKKVNVLSCSTTFEMGVDVGSLETVFMRNMPPSPANYAQRAGRAGRSLRSAAYAITFCPNSSHDLNYFKNPIEMIRGTIKPPYFNISNDKIVLRHIFASAFSYFWKKYPDFYTESIGKFMEKRGFDKLREYLDAKPEDLKLYLKQIVPTDLQSHYGINSFKWTGYMFDNDDMKKGLCNIVVDKYNDDIKELENAKNQMVLENNSRVAQVMRSIKTIQDQRIIEFLSKNSLIPKYGFPVDTVELQSGGMGNHNLMLRLNRDLTTAISEYAPESEIVADGNLIKSRYVRKLSGYEWPTYNYVKCQNCQTLNRALYVDDIKICRQCGKELTERKRQYIIPKFGFLMDNAGPKPVGPNKPERTYKGLIYYIGDENKIEFHENFVCGRRILLGNSKMDSLAVLNESSFYICETCGYGHINEKCFDRKIEYKHKNFSGYDCSSKLLTAYTIGHEFQTDVALLKFVDIDVSKPEEAWTILYSMLEGLSRSMNIDRNELSGCLTWYRDVAHPSGNFAFVLFDNTPGGAGYVRQLVSPYILVNMLKEGFRVVSNCSCGGEMADTACYSCLCNYYNQKQHDVLKRKYAIGFYQQINSNYFDEWTAIRNEEVYGIEDLSSRK